MDEVPKDSLVDLFLFDYVRRHDLVALPPPSFGGVSSLRRLPTCLAGFDRIFWSRLTGYVVDRAADGE